MNVKKNDELIVSTMMYRDQCAYKNLLIVNGKPEGCFSEIVQKVDLCFDFVQNNNFVQNHKNVLVIFSLRYPERFMTMDEVNDLYFFLCSNGYKISINFSEFLKKNIHDKVLFYVKNNKKIDSLKM
jgi:hypothetical protein